MKVPDGFYDQHRPSDRDEGARHSSGSSIVVIGLTILCTLTVLGLVLGYFAIAGGL
jgi:hypothetical protein